MKRGLVAGILGIALWIAGAAPAEAAPITVKIAEFVWFDDVYDPVDPFELLAPAYASLQNMTSGLGSGLEEDFTDIEFFQNDALLAPINVAGLFTAGPTASAEYFSFDPNAGTLFVTFTYLGEQRSGALAPFASSPHDIFYTYELPDTAVVPEPASMTLLGIGLAGLAARHRRRTRTH